MVMSTRALVRVMVTKKLVNTVSILTSRILKTTMLTFNSTIVKPRLLDRRLVLSDTEFSYESCVCVSLCVALVAVGYRKYSTLNRTRLVANDQRRAARRL